MTVRHFVLPAVAAGLLGVAIASAVRADGGRIARDPPAPVPSSPFPARIAGTGLVEPPGEEIAVAAAVSGLVERVHVATGDRVRAGDTLFTLDAADLRAEVLRRRASAAHAAAELARLRSLPRPEDVPPAEARVAEAEARVAEARTRLAMIERVTDVRAVTEEDRARRRHELAAAEANVSEARAELARLRAGASAEEIAVAAAAVAEADAATARAQADVDRTIVRAPCEADVLEVDVRPGEFAPAAGGGDPLLVLGAPGALHVRVDVDEADAWRVRADVRAEACVRGNAALRVPLEFVRVEPRVIPKKNLSGFAEERIDTRVLQVVFRMEPGAVPVYVGQQMDVFLEAPADAVRGAAVPATTGEGGVK